MNINMNLVCEHHELSLSVAGLSGSIKPPELFINNLNYMNKARGLQVDSS